MDDEWFGSDGAFEEVVENQRIAYTDRWINFPEAEVDSRATVEFSDAEDGTEVVLTATVNFLPVSAYVLTLWVIAVLLG